MSDPVQYAMLVLSDLHFGADFLLEAEINPLQVPFWLKFNEAKLRRFFETRCKAHDMAIVMSLPKYLKKVLRQLNAEEFPRYRFDFVLLLGDLATYANGGSYSFLTQFLVQDKYEYAGGKTIRGLRGIHNGQLIAIPGNHDKLLRKNLDIYHMKFSVALGVDAEPKPQGAFFISHNIGGSEFLFVLVDANKYASTDGTLDFSAFSHLASGEVTKLLKNNLLEKFEALRSRREVDKAKLDSFETARKILIVHYAVDVEIVLGPAPHAEELVLSHRCAGLDNLVKELRPYVDFVLHGHLHRPKIYNHCGVPVISATTTTQKDGWNGFYIIKFLASGDIVFDHHKWNENGFTKDDTAELSARVSLPVDRTKLVSKQVSGR